MKKTLAIFAAFCIISMTACFSPWDGSGDQGTIVIDFGNDGARTLAEGDVYTVILTDSGETTMPPKEITSGKVSFSVQPGPWNILVRRATSAGRLNGYGETDVEVQAGATVPASVTVKPTNATRVVSTWADLKDVFEKNASQSLAESVIIIRDLSADSSINLKDQKWNITLLADKNVTITKSKAIDNSLFRVLAGCELTLDGTGGGRNITISGGGLGQSSLVLVENGKLIMYDGVTLTNNRISSKNYNTRGGGVTVNGGTFEMKGGTISGNSAEYGGGVRILSGTFTKEGGTIYGANEGSSSNTATKGGYAVYYDSSKKSIDNTFGPGDKL